MAASHCSLPGNVPTSPSCLPIAKNYHVPPLQTHLSYYPLRAELWVSTLWTMGFFEVLLYVKLQHMSVCGIQNGSVELLNLGVAKGWINRPVKTSRERIPKELSRQMAFGNRPLARQVATINDCYLNICSYWAFGVYSMPSAPSNVCPSKKK